MQIDFHHAVTYVCARAAGFSTDQAGIIAHSAQYVDDATAAGEIWFENGMIFPRMASAHKMLDHKNADELANHRVWLPFHFLPGNNNQPVSNPIPHFDADEYMRRCICRPNSHPARELMQAVIKRQDRPYALYRLGIASHVFMDTWAHQGFVGFQHQVNVASDIDAEDAPDEHHNRGLVERVVDYVKDGWTNVKSALVGAALPLGHGAVLTYPDRPYLRWSYTNGLNERVERNNPDDFATAFGETYQCYRRYRDYPRLGVEVFEKTYPLPECYEAVIRHIGLIDDDKGETRHKRWLQLIEDGEFGFAEKIEYIDKGEGSWKHAALGTIDDVADLSKLTPLPFPPSFLGSHWKLFHDGLLAHRFFVLHELLPKYGLLNG